MYHIMILISICKESTERMERKREHSGCVLSVLPQRDKPYEEQDAKWSGKHALAQEKEGLNYK